MAVAKKHRRKIVCRDGVYYWWVREADTCSKMILSIVSDDKRLMILYPLGQPTESRYLVSVGRIFKGKATNGCWKRYRFWELEGIGPKQEAVTPGMAARILEWCLSEGEADEVTWDGRDYWL